MAGYGDELMRTGLARGAKERGKRIAFGDKRVIKWGPHSAEIFKANPNIAPPGSERDRDIEWIEDYKGHRLYMRGGGAGFVFNMNHRARPGEMFFEARESKFAEQFEPGFLLIEPNVPAHKSCAPNKQWPVDRYESIASEFTSAGYRVVQFGYPGARHRLRNARYVNAPSFRHALALLARARLAILPEGGLHHGAAAVGVKAVVLFGGFIPPAVTGYDMHVNLDGGAEACGSLQPCEHCKAAMAAISTDDVLKAADGLLAHG